MHHYGYLSFGLEATHCNRKPVLQTGDAINCVVENLEYNVQATKSRDISVFAVLFLSFILKSVTLKYPNIMEISAAYIYYYYY